MGSLAWGLCIMPIYSQVSLEGHIWVSYQKGVFYGIEVVHFPCTNFWNLMSDWEGHQVAVNFTCIYCKCRYASDSILALTCLIDRFHGIFYYGNWRALHHHTACWLINIHIAWPFAFQLQLVAIVKRQPSICNGVILLYSLVIKLLHTQIMIESRCALCGGYELR